MEKNKFVVPAGLTAINNLGYMYKLRGDYDLARKYYLEALEGRKEYFGKENKNTLITMNNLLLLERITITWKKQRSMRKKSTTL